MPGNITGQNNPIADDERSIRELVQTWMTATKAGDLQTVLSLMTDDVVFMTPGNEPFGKEMFAATAKKMEAAFLVLEGTSDIREIQVLGDWAYLRNYIEITMTMSDSPTPTHRSGYTLTILRKESDGRWRIARDANLLTVRKNS
jgi:uncharacterized protein (TIGR02246 family)